MAWIGALRICDVGTFGSSICDLPYLKRSLDDTVASSRVSLAFPRIVLYLGSHFPLRALQGVPTTGKLLKGRKKVSSVIAPAATAGVVGCSTHRWTVVSYRGVVGCSTYRWTVVSLRTSPSSARLVSNTTSEFVAFPIWGVRPTIYNGSETHPSRGAVFVAIIFFCLVDEGAPQTRVTSLATAIFARRLAWFSHECNLLIL